MRREFPMAEGYDFSIERTHQAPHEKNKKKKTHTQIRICKINNITFKDESTDSFKENKKQVTDEGGRIRPAYSTGRMETKKGRTFKVTGYKQRLPCKINHRLGMRARQEHFQICKESESIPPSFLSRKVNLPGHT